MSSTLAVSAMTLLAQGRWRVRVDVGRVVVTDSARRGAVAVRPRRGVVRRAEPGSAGAGPFVLEARSEPDGVALEVWGPPGTDAETASSALEATARWVGLRDDLAGFAEVTSAHPVTHRLVRELGEVRLGRLPRVGEAFGRAVLGQLVQAVEAHRSTAQVAALAGTPATATPVDGTGTGGGLWAWPTARQIGATPAWALRRCGVSLRGARALHEGALADRQLAESARAAQWARLDRQLCALPGVGPWTSGETRLALGDADAISVGDYHLPSLVGSALGSRPAERRTDYDDAEMLALLAPFAPHRGRVIRLVEQAAVHGLVARPPRRGPRAALSAHRYW